jgi:hypothetical protein
MDISQLSSINIPNIIQIGANIFYCFSLSNNLPVNFVAKTYPSEKQGHIGRIEINACKGMADNQMLSEIL